ncbi:hypothetical protein OUZ56_008334 [Daphnia magna]|uniref:Uncharacterized protein n=1 Tax=Daphnia magna TaxID=35525 RepID=A0ABR0ACN0_9CRUS|nr:hypothetical protein OUZ56_008334 [Daphnia magna]
MGTLLRLSITCYSSPPLRAQTPVPFKLWSAFLIGNIDCRTLLGDLRSIHLELLCRKTLRDVDVLCIQEQPTFTRQVSEKRCPTKERRYTNLNKEPVGLDLARILIVDCGMRRENATKCFVKQDDRCTASECNYFAKLNRNGNQKRYPSLKCLKLLRRLYSHVVDDETEVG